MLFSKVIPGGNPTIILHDPELDPERLGEAAARLMGPMHLQAEQVGALYAGTGDAPRLVMMGGEFCVNATRAAAVLLAGQGLLGECIRPAPAGTAPSCPVPAGTDSSCTSLSCTSPCSGPVPHSPGAATVCHNDGIPDAPRFWAGHIQVSGMARPVRVVVSTLDNAAAPVSASLYAGFSPSIPAEAGGGSGTSFFSGTVRSDETGVRPAPAWSEDMPHELHCAARVECSFPDTVCREAGQGLCLVTMPGMRHLLVDADMHPPPSFSGQEWRECAARWRNAHGLSDASASGVIWYAARPDGFAIWPAVAVRASGSEHLETACGSASLALALWQWKLSACPEPLAVHQPSERQLTVIPEFSDTGPSGEIPAAWIAGSVSIVAQGRVFL